MSTASNNDRKLSRSKRRKSPSPSFITDSSSSNVSLNLSSSSSTSSNTVIEQKKSKRSRTHSNTLKLNHKNYEIGNTPIDEERKKILEIERNLKTKQSQEELEKQTKKRKREKKKKIKDKRDDVESADIPLDLMQSSGKSMAPMTKEQWEKKQSEVRRVFDETTGRYRLIKGDGEVIEEIVSRDRHKAINQQATKGDGDYFQAKLMESASDKKIKPL